jgi:hypothetical protein
MSATTNQSFLKCVNRIMTRYDEPDYHADKIHHEAPYRIAGHPEIKCTIVFDRIEGQKTYGGFLEIHGKQVLDCGGYDTASAVREAFKRRINAHLDTEAFIEECAKRYELAHLYTMVADMTRGYR